MQRGLVLIAVGVILLLGVGCGSSGNSTEMTTHLSVTQARARHKAKQAARHRVRQERAEARHQAKVRAKKAAARRRARHRHQLEVRRQHREEREARRLALAEEREQREAEKEERAASEESQCDPNYSGACLDPYSSDYDCEGGSGNGPDYTGEVQVIGVDHYGLDADGDGIGCEPG